MVVADPDETCPGVWIETDFETGHCSLGDECRNPNREAHKRLVNGRPVMNTDDL